MLCSKARFREGWQAVKVLVPIVIFVAIIAGGVGASIWKKSQTADTAPYPPVGAQFLDPGTAPGDLMAIGATRKKHKPDPLTSFQGLWVSEPGWEGTVEIVADEPGGQTLRWQQNGGGFWVIAVLKDTDSRVKVGSQVRVMGMFEDANTIISDYSPMPQNRVILKNAKILEIK